MPRGPLAHQNYGFLVFLHPKKPPKIGLGSKLILELEFEQTMYLPYMKGKKTAEMYSRGSKALPPRVFDWKDAGVGTADDPIDELTLCAQMQGWKAFITWMQEVIYNEFLKNLKF